MKRWSATCAQSSALPKAAKASPAQLSWMAEPCKAVAKAGCVQRYDGYKRRKGSKVHMAVDTLGHLIALTVTPADEQA